MTSELLQLRLEQFPSSEEAGFPRRLDYCVLEVLCPYVSLLYIPSTPSRYQVIYGGYVAVVRCMDCCQVSLRRTT